jgi:hypothetical protein
MHSSLFNTQSLHEWDLQTQRRLLNEIDRMPREKLFEKSEDELALQVRDSYVGEVPVLHKEDLYSEGVKGHPGDRAVSMAIHTPFDGDGTFFGCHPSTHPIITNPCEVKNQELIITYSNLQKSDVERLQVIHNDTLQRIIGCLDDMRRAMVIYFDELLMCAKYKIMARRKDFTDYDAIMRTAGSIIPIKRRPETATKIVLPVARKQIPVAKQEEKHAPPEPMIDLKAYDDILQVISSMMKVVERSPKVFREMEEEDLRTILLVALNGIYEGRASGETFNGTGKTDILIRESDRNVFIGECLEWKGEAGFLSKIDDQLLKYATWRDCKLALIVFNRNKDFTAVVEKMAATLMKHPQFVKKENHTHESGFRCTFRRKDDQSRTFLVTGLAFDINIGSAE